MTATTQRCPEPAVFAIGTSDGTMLACPGHVLGPMSEVASRDGLGVFWPTNGQCFAQIPEDAPQPGWLDQLADASLSAMKAKGGKA